MCQTRAIGNNRRHPDEEVKRKSCTSKYVRSFFAEMIAPNNERYQNEKNLNGGILHESTKVKRSSVENSGTHSRLQ